MTKSKNGKNGNPDNEHEEKGNIVDEIKKVLKNQKPDGTIVINDLVPASILSMFFLQKLGKADLSEVVEAYVKIGAEINEHLCEQSCDALQARGLVSYARGRKGAAGEAVKMWKPKQAIWSSPPEMAHIKDLLPALVSTDEAEELISKLNDSEEEGEGEKKKKQKLGYTEYVDVEVKFRTLDELLGSQPSSPWLDQIVKKSPHKGVTADIRFWRDPRNGEIQLARDNVRAWLRTGLRTEGFAETVCHYIGVDPIRIVPNAPMCQVGLPIVDHQGGKGITTYEVLPPGQEFSTVFRIPTRGFMSAEKFILFLCSYGPRSLRGLSPARGARFGIVEVIGFRVIGKQPTTKEVVASVRQLMSPDAQKCCDEAMLAFEKTMN